jgi:hypothetical protein
MTKKLHPCLFCSNSRWEHKGILKDEISFSYCLWSFQKLGDFCPIEDKATPLVKKILEGMHG